MTIRAEANVWADRQPGGDVSGPLHVSVVLTAEDGGLSAVSSVLAVSLERGDDRWTGMPERVGPESDLRLEYAIRGPAWTPDQRTVDVELRVATIEGDRSLRLEDIPIRIVE